MRRVIPGLILAATILCGASQSADAQLIPNVYNFIFGGPQYPYGYGYGYGGGFGYRTAYYRPAFYQPAPVTSYYAPAVSCCDPCQVACSPCSSGCPNGNCSVDPGGVDGGATDDNWQPSPEGEGAPRTFRDDAPMTQPRTPAEPAEPGLDPEGRQPGNPFGDPGQTDVESLRPESGVPQRKPAPIEEPNIEEPKAGDAKKPAPVEAPAEEETAPAGNEELFFPPLEVDEKVTWRPQPVRSRLTIHSRFPTPGIARHRVNPNEEWVPVSTATKIVSK